MITVTEEVLSKMVEAIVKEVDPERIYLFGSRARGEEKPESDADLLIVEREPFGHTRGRFQEINRIYDLLSSFRIPTDILVYSTNEFDKWRKSPNHVIGRCQREGRLLYARH